MIFIIIIFVERGIAHYYHNERPRFFTVCGSEFWNVIYDFINRVHNGIFRIGFVFQYRVRHAVHRFFIFSIYGFSQLSLGLIFKQIENRKHSAPPLKRLYAVLYHKKISLSILWWMFCWGIQYSSEFWNFKDKTSVMVKNKKRISCFFFDFFIFLIQKSFCIFYFFHTHSVLEKQGILKEKKSEKRRISSFFSFRNTFWLLFSFILKKKRRVKKLSKNKIFFSFLYFLEMFDDFIV